MNNPEAISLDRNSLLSRWLPPATPNTHTQTNFAGRSGKNSPWGKLTVLATAAHCSKLQQGSAVSMWRLPGHAPHSGVQMVLFFHGWIGEAFFFCCCLSTEGWQLGLERKRLFRGGRSLSINNKQIFSPVIGQYLDVLGPWNREGRLQRRKADQLLELG